MKGIEITDSFIQAVSIKKKWLKTDIVAIEGNYYRASLLQEAYKKICKRGSGATLTEITCEGHVLTLTYRTRYGKGRYRII